MTHAIGWTIIIIAMLGMLAVIVAVPIARALKREQESDPS